MEVDELRTFLAIAETGGFSRAGQRLHRSQPAISRRLGWTPARVLAYLAERELAGTVQRGVDGRYRIARRNQAQ